MIKTVDKILDDLKRQRYSTVDTNGSLFIITTATCFTRTGKILNKTAPVVWITFKVSHVSGRRAIVEILDNDIETAVRFAHASYPTLLERAKITACQHYHPESSRR